MPPLFDVKTTNRQRSAVLLTPFKLRALVLVRTPVLLASRVTRSAVTAVRVTAEGLSREGQKG